MKNTEVHFFKRGSRFSASKVLAPRVPARALNPAFLSTKFLYMLALAASLMLLSCSKSGTRAGLSCPSSIQGQILDRVTEKPLAGVKVFGQGIGDVSGWGNASYLPFDTVVTDSTGFYEFRSEVNVPNWNIQTFTYGHDFSTTSFWGSNCEHVEEDLFLDQFATVVINTVDDPASNFDSLYIFTLPGINYGYYEGYGNDHLSLQANESGEMWHKPDSVGLIRYWFLDDPDGDVFDIEIDISGGDTLVLEIEM